MSVAFREIDRATRRAQLRRFTDLELVIAGRDLRNLIASAKMVISLDGDGGERWEAQLVDVIAEWRSRRALRSAGLGVCLCHAPGDTPMTGNARTWRASGYDRWMWRQLFPTPLAGARPARPPSPV